VALVFLPTMLIFVNSLLREIVGPLPVVVSATVTVLLLLQP
jgi:hypothetical protein